MTINYLMKNRGDAQNAVLVNKEKDTIRSFIDPQFAYVPAKRIYDVVETRLKDIEVVNSVVSDECIEIVAFSPEFDTHIVDSPVRAGLRILFSDSWSVYPRFDSYICRIQCLNSAITPIEKRKFRVSKKSETDILLQAQSFIDTAVKNIKPMIEGFEKLENEQVENWLSLVKKICQENKLPKKLQDMISLTANDPQFLATVSNKKIETMHDMVNLLTYVATHHPELTAVNRENLFSIAGHIMLHHDTRCDSCGGTLV
jgi:hypothetical protein